VPRWKNGLQTSDEVYRLKRNAVLREATRIIARNGFHNTSLDDVAEALQVSKGTLYNYIADKQEILFECHMMSLDIGLHAAALAEEHGTTGYDKLRLNLRAYIRWQNQALGGGGVTSDVTALRPADRRIVIARRDELDARLVSYLQEGFRDGTIRRLDPKLAVFTFMGAVNAVQSWYSPKGRLELGEIADGMVDILMHGLGTGAAHDDVDTVPIPPYGLLGNSDPTGVGTSIRQSGDAPMARMPAGAGKGFKNVKADAPPERSRIRAPQTRGAGSKSGAKKRQR
jgi:AcrR family transcriptional regulator